MRLNITRQPLFVYAVVLATDISILLNVPFMRQVLGFLCFTIIPGFLIIKTLRIEKIEFLKLFVRSTGLSIFCMIMVGLLTSVLLPVVGYTTPLSCVPTLISLNILIIVLSFFAYRANNIQHELVQKFHIKDIKLPSPHLLLPILIPLLGIIGIYLMNIYRDNTLLLVSLALIPLYIILLITLTILNKHIPDGTYAIALLMISLAVLLQEGMASNYPLGGDIYSEYNVFQTTLMNLRWDAGHWPEMLTSSTSISVLPTMLTSLLGINPTFVFKIVLILLISILPLITYTTFKAQLGSFYAFLTSFFVIAQLPFMHLLPHIMRVGISAIPLFLVIDTLLDVKLLKVQRSTLLIIFMTTTIITYYVTPIILVAIMILSYLISKIYTRIVTSKHPPQIISPANIYLVTALAFFWWGIITPQAFTNYTQFIERILSNLRYLVSASTRSTGVTRIFDLSATTAPDKALAITNDIIFVIIIAGVICAFLIKRNSKITNSGLPSIMLSCLIMLGFIVILPFVSSGYAPDRFYVQVIAFLAPSFILGVIMIRKPNWKKLYLSIISLILIIQFLCNSFMIHHAMGIPKSLTFNTDSLDRIRLYVYDTDVRAAAWLGGYNDQNLTVFIGHLAQPLSGDVIEFTEYGTIRTFEVVDFNELIRLYNEGVLNEQNFIFLKHVNVIDGLLFDIDDPNTSLGSPVSIDNYSYIYNYRNKIYTTGDTYIFQ